MTDRFSKSIRVVEATVNGLLEDGDTVTGISYKLKSGVVKVRKYLKLILAVWSRTQKCFLDYELSVDCRVRRMQQQLPQAIG